MQQLQLMKPKILTRLNERLGNQAIKDIFWRRGKIEPVLAAPTEPDRRRPPPLPAEETARIEAVVAPLSDPELRQRLQHFLVRQAQLDLSRRKD
jgi:hypothetical protein